MACRRGNVSESQPGAVNKCIQLAKQSTTNLQESVQVKVGEKIACKNCLIVVRVP